MAFKKGDVIFGRRRAYQRKLAVAEFDGICSAHAMVVRAKPKMILPEFLPFFLQSDMFMERAIEISVGSLSPTINWKTLQVQEFPLPPLDEQKRIAELLWAADEVVEKYVSTHGHIDELLRVTQQKVFSDALSNYGPIPIGQIADVKGGKRLPKGEAFSEHPTDHPYLRVVDFANSTIDTKNLQYLKQDTFEKIKRYTISSENVYISIAGTVGIVGVIPESLDGANLTENAAKLVLSDTRFSKEYLMHFLQSEPGRQQISNSTMTTTQPKLALTRLASITLPNVPIMEQIRIVREIESLTKARESIADHLTQSKIVKGSIASRLIQFGGVNV